jgi:Zn-dependent peptidase ImmA (M78 family)
LSENPEINLARRVQQKFELGPPVDILAVVERYARVLIRPLPLDIDGVSLNLKVPRKKPLIILNDRRPETRKRFTLAHELGHVLIPWHYGTIIDNVGAPTSGRDSLYWELEGEANRFAAELLMPHGWLARVITTRQNPCEIVDLVARQANVSMDAAIIRTINALDPGYVYALVDGDGLVIASGRSAGTLASVPGKGTYLDGDTTFPTCASRWEAHWRDGAWLWWYFAKEAKLPALSETRDWRQTLDNILNDISLPPIDTVNTKQTINGIIAYVNGVISRGSHRPTPEILYAATIQRFYSRSLTDPILHECVTHRDFSLFLAKRVRALFAK